MAVAKVLDDESNEIVDYLGVIETDMDGKEVSITVCSYSGDDGQILYIDIRRKCELAGLIAQLQYWYDKME